MCIDCYLASVPAVVQTGAFSELEEHWILWSTVNAIKCTTGTIYCTWAKLYSEVYLAVLKIKTGPIQGSYHLFPIGQELVHLDNTDRLHCTALHCTGAALVQHCTADLGDIPNAQIDPLHPDNLQPAPHRLHKGSDVAVKPGEVKSELPTIQDYLMPQIILKSAITVLWDLLWSNRTCRKDRLLKKMQMQMQMQMQVLTSLSS